MSLSKVCLIAANNSITEDNKKIDYVRLASIAAERAKYYLDLPILLLTSDIEEASKYAIFDEIIEQKQIKNNSRTVIAGKKTLKYNWLNDSRIDAYDLTKNLADKTLMIDADYMIASDQLKIWLDSDYPFYMFDLAYDVTGRGIYSNNYFPSNDIVQRWATAICWDNSEEAKIIFETAKMVRDNYAFYATMLGMLNFNYRNDVAFSIACHLHNIKINNYQKLYNLPPSCYMKYIDAVKEWLIFFDDKCVRWYHDIHVINKEYAIDYDLMNNLRLKNVAA